MECTRCLCDKPHHCTCTMSQASTWLTPQGDRVQRRSLHATRTHTHPFGQTRHAVSCIACMDIPPHAYDACRTMSRHYRVSTNATRADCTHAIHYCTYTCTSCTKIDDRYYFRNEQTPNPFLPKRLLFVSKKITVITDDP